MQPDDPWFATVRVSRGRKRTIRPLALETPEEEGIVGMTSPIHRYVSRKAARQLESCQVRKWILDFEVCASVQSQCRSSSVQGDNAQFCQFTPSGPFGWPGHAWGNEFGGVSWPFTALLRDNRSTTVVTVVSIPVMVCRSSQGLLKTGFTRDGRFIPQVVFLLVMSLSGILETRFLTAWHGSRMMTSFWSRWSGRPRVESEVYV